MTSGFEYSGRARLFSRAENPGLKMVGTIESRALPGLKVLCSVGFADDRQTTTLSYDLDQNLRHHESR
jgi:hypothetical protein